MGDDLDARDAAAAALRELILAGERYRIVAASHLDLTVNESRAISFLLSRGPMGNTDLSTALGLTTGATTTLVDRLVARQFVRRVADGDDRRRSTIQISATGRRKIGRVQDWLPNALPDVAAPALLNLEHSMRSITSALHALTDDAESMSGRQRGSRAHRGRRR